MSGSDAGQGGRSLNDVLDDIGFGRAQWWATLLGGQIYFSEGCVLLVVGISAGVVAKEWSLEPVERAWLVAVVFLGVLLGSSMSGALCDSLGRRIPLVLSLFGLAGAAMLTTLAKTLAQLVAARAFLGILIGIGIPAWLALGSELTPKRSGYTVSNVAMMMFPLGEVSALMFAYFLDPKVADLDWRTLVMLTSVPLLLVSIPTMWCLPESPRYLVAKNRVEDAEEVLRTLARWNGREEVNVKLDLEREEPESDDDEGQEPLLPQQSAVESLRGLAGCGRRVSRVTTRARVKIMSASAAFFALFRQKHCYITLTLCLTTAALNFSFYGGLYTFPHVLGQLHVAMSPASSLIFAALAELPGFAFGLILYNLGFSAKQSYLTFVSGTCAATILFLFASDPAFDHSQPDQQGYLQYWPRRFNTNLVLFALCGIKFFNSLGWALAYGFTPLVYPTSVRALGCSFIVTVGRLGAISCPIVYELLLARTKGYRAYFYFMLAIAALNMALVAGLPSSLGRSASEDAKADESIVRPKTGKPRKGLVENYSTLTRPLTPPPAA